MSENVYQAPKVWGSDPSPHGTASFNSTPRRRSAMAGLQWLSQAWQIFVRSPGLWIGILASLFLASIISQFVPLVGPLAQNLLAPTILGGLMLGCHAVAAGGLLRFDHLFAGFSRNFANLVILGVINLFATGVIAAIALLAFVATAGGAFPAMPDGGDFSPDLIAPLSIAVLMALLFFLPLSMANWFAVALVAINDLRPLDAMKTSFLACLVNLGPFLIYGLLFLVIGFLATLPFGLGWLVAAPVLIASTYTSYRDVFYAG